MNAQETQRPTAERSLRDLLDLSGGAAIVTGGAMGIGQGSRSASRRQAPLS